MNPKKRKAEDEGGSSEIKKEPSDENVPEDYSLAANDETTVQTVNNHVKLEGSDVTGDFKKVESSDVTGDFQKVESSDVTGDFQKVESSDVTGDFQKLDGSNVSGELLFCGATNWDLVARRELPKNAKNAVGKNLWGPHRLQSLQGIKITSVFAGCSAAHSVIIAEGGKAMTWGRNDKGQLGHCDILRRDVPTLVETLKDHNIVSASCGRGHTLFLSDRGIVYSCGDNKHGQTGLGSQNNTINIPTKIKFKGDSVTSVACGAEFSMIIDSRGGLYSFGLPEYGQLGHNSDGRYFVTSNKMAFKGELTPRRITTFIEKSREGHVSLVDDVHIIKVACGINHSVAVDSQKRCFSWGFGGYGRLGHAEQKDEMVPRLIKAFDGPKNVRGVKKIFCGGSYSMAVIEYDVLYFFGQNKRTGEATMYPKPVQDLVGWKVRDVGCCNCSIVVVADESVISWGPSPTFGELGFGEGRPKSSTTPQEVKPLDGIHIHAIACGYSHTLLIAQNDTEEDRAKLSKLPEYTP